MPLRFPIAKEVQSGFDSRPDSGFDHLVEVIPASSFTSRPASARFIPAIPVEFIQQTRIAGDSLAVLLVALAEMRMRGVSEIPIGPRIWAAVGVSGRRVRARLLRQIGELPSDLCTTISRKGRPHLLQAGPSWPKRTP